MKISATVGNSRCGHKVIVRAGAITRYVEVPAKPRGKGSAVNGGEFGIAAPTTRRGFLKQLHPVLWLLLFNVQFPSASTSVQLVSRTVGVRKHDHVAQKSREEFRPFGGLPRSLNSKFFG
jgi:hypothetical protein